MAERRAGVEWLGAVAPVQANVADARGGFVAHVLLWADDEGRPLGTAVGREEDMIEAAGAHLARMMKTLPAAARPARVRVGSEALAAALRAAHPRLEVVVGDTPRLDALFESMRADIGRGFANVPAFYAATAALFRAAPWKFVPATDGVFGVDIPALEVEGALVSVMGAEGHERGFVFFENAEHFEDFIGLAEDMMAGGDVTVPPHVALSFERSTELPAAFRDEVKKNGWEIAGDDAYPQVTIIGHDGRERGPDGRDTAVVEAIAKALVQVCADQEAIVAAMEGGEAYERTVEVELRGEPVEVTLSTVSSAPNPSFELIAQFRESAEGKPFTDFDATGVVFELAAEVFGASAHDLMPNQLRKLIFDVVPREVEMSPDDAGVFLAELRAFYAFLAREKVVLDVKPFLRVLDQRAEKKLAAALSAANR